MKITVFIPINYFLNFLLILFLSYSQLKGQTVETGKIGNAPFKIIIPKNWNKGLIMYVRGAGGGGPKDDLIEDEYKRKFNNVITSRGYAVAYSAFSIKDDAYIVALEETEALRSYFENKYGIPKKTIITGHSMGGMISIATIEKYKDKYDGALPMCTFLGSPNLILKMCLDRLVTFDYFFGPNDGKIITSKEIISDEEIKRLISKNKSFAKIYSEYLKVKEKDISVIIGFSQWVIKGNNERLGGLAMGNLYTIYDGFDKYNQKLNQNVRRYKANEKVRDFFSNNRNSIGELSDPVLNILTTYDPLLPSGHNEIYKYFLEKEGTLNLFAQQYIDSDGHCNISNNQFASALDNLLDWIETGKRPEFKEIK